jgi:hypothetical protein
MATGNPIRDVILLMCRERLRRDYGDASPGPITSRY